MHKKYNKHFNFKYKNITFLIFSLLTAFFLGTNPYFGSLLSVLSGLGLVGGLVAGALFVSSFTVAIGVLLLGLLLPSLGLWPLTATATIGAIITDLIIFKYVRNSGLLGEIIPIYKGLGGSHISRLFNTKYFRWTLPLIGALIVASPLPDEVGVTLMGLSKIKTWQFVTLSMFLNAVGILFLILSFSILA